MNTFSALTDNEERPIDKHAPIGIFDSGIGGLTVANAVATSLPGEDIIYFGDTARVPYGIKSEVVVKQYALEITRFLLTHNVKMILIACNTVSAAAKAEVQELAGDIPVLDVITAGTEAAGSVKAMNRLGVIGTLATVSSQAYVRSVEANYPGVQVVQQACPLLVPLAEEGWTDNSIARDTLREYLSVFNDQKPDALILGCTHYPLFRESIAEIMGEDVVIIDSAASIAAEAHARLDQESALNSAGGSFRCFVSDRPQRFQELAERFLGRTLNAPEVITL